MIPLLLEPWVRDVRHALRGLARARGYTATWLVVFSVCLAAHVAIFSIVDRVVLRPLPYRDSNRLVTVFDSYPGAGLARGGVSPLHYLERERAVPAFAEAAAWVPWTVALEGEGSPESVELMDVTPSFFRVLGVNAALGRTLLERDVRDRAVVISDALWRGRFNADPAILGRQIRIDHVPFTVIGVMPRDFQYLSQHAGLWTPLSFSDADRRPDQRYRTGMEMIARLREGASVHDAQSQLDALNRQPVSADVLAAIARKMGFHTVVRDLHADLVAPIRPVLLLLDAGALCLLLIGAVNLANLALVRAIGRAREFGVQQALGASWRQLVRSQVIESLLLAAAGTLLGLALGEAGLRALVVLAADRLPMPVAPQLDLATCLVAAFTSLLLALLLSLPGIWQTLRGNLSGSLAQDSRSSTSSGTVRRLRHGLVEAQIALAFVLLAGAGLLASSFQRLLTVDPGFRADHVLTGVISLPWSAYPEPAQRAAFAERLLRTLRSVPGVKTAGLSTRVPFAGSDASDYTPIQIEGRTLSPAEAASEQYNRAVGGDYFGAMGVPLRAGRLLAVDDERPASKGCVIDETLAARYWPRGDAFGHRLVFGVTDPKRSDYFTVVGIVGSVKQNSLADRGGFGVVYYPNALFPAQTFTVAMRTAGDPAQGGSALRAAVLQIDPGLPIMDLTTMTSRVSDSLAGRRAPLLLAAVFAGVALVLASVGIYGVLAYTVAQRRREIGVRMALGAAPGQILRLFVRFAFRLLAVGLPCGLIGARIAGRMVAGMLYDVSPGDPVVLLGTAFIVVAMALLACLIPSRSAARLSPIEALR